MNGAAMATATRTFTVTRSDGRLRRDATEQRILTATNELLDAGASLAGLSVNRIVQAAGVARATFYLHFQDKRALVARLAATELAEFERLTDPFLDSPDAGREELAAAIGALAVLWREHAGVLSSLIELAEYDAEAREAWQQVVREVGERIAGALRGRRPDLAPREAATLDETIAWAGERAAHQMIGREATAARARAVAQALTELIWRTIDVA